MSSQAVSLSDKYELDRGQIYITGTQALVRIPIAQGQRDRAAGLNTGGFISGYRGSPLGGYDRELLRAKALLARENIHFNPGVNEDLAATSVWGSQQTNLIPGAKFDGVFGIWYGKGPGVDRSLDALKHANSAGVDPRGGVLAIFGDDHGAVSSSTAHQSEQVFASALIPVVSPANLEEYIEFGIKGFALSRYSGCWVAFKAVTEIAESSGTIQVDPLGIEIHTPTDFEMPEGGLGIRAGDTQLAAEARLHGPKMAAVAAFARANGFDKTIFRPAGARIGIVATGKAYGDLIHALRGLGLTEERAAELGVGLYKVGLTWPLEATGIKAFAEGMEELIVVEEKLGFVEDQIARVLYGMPERPRIVGKFDESNQVLLPSAGELDPVMVARVVASRILAILDDQRLRQALGAVEDRACKDVPSVVDIKRTPFFCSGCPHNTSTRVPDGSRAMPGIGCHLFVQQIPERRTSLLTHMGAEGAVRIGQAPFTSEPHIFQNIGDGTYYHSGLLAIRAASAAGINITYKVLFNDAVAMTGGQVHDGPLSPPLITRQVHAEGAKKIYVVTDEPEKYDDEKGFAPGVLVRHRSELDAIQKELREIPGLTVIVYDQTCAAEKRRRRKRGQYFDPPKRVFINNRVCEGCGDCSAKSNCISVKPLETEFGLKRQIDQSDCNKDFSCLNGFCPSFVTVHGGKVRKSASKVVAGASGSDALRTPELPAIDGAFNILVTGIGGTGVITIGALLGMAAHIEGKGCSVLDFTGLAQKNGSVTSHIRLAQTSSELDAVRIAAGETNALLACDLLVAAEPDTLSRLDPAVTRAVINGVVQPTAEFIRNANIDLSAIRARKAVKNAVHPDSQFVPATQIATTLLGDSIATNLFMLGYAWQKGLIPLTRESLFQAIELNGVAVSANKEAFECGRRAAEGLLDLEALGVPQEKPAQLTLPELIERRAADLVAYQDAAYADRYRKTVQLAIDAETRLGTASGFAEAVARNLYKLMAYKDEYEVARLYSDPAFLEGLNRQFDGDFRLEFNLAPPLFSRRDPLTGELQKRTYGAWMLPVFKVLARFKKVRGTWLDVFGYTEERRTERALVAEYEQIIAGIVAALNESNGKAAIDLARWPETIKGFGHVKEANLSSAREKLPDLWGAFESSEPMATAA